MRDMFLFDSYLRLYRHVWVIELIEFDGFLLLFFFMLYLAEFEQDKAELRNIEMIFIYQGH